VIAGPKNWSKVEAFLGNRYHRFEVIRIWWPTEDYKNLTWERLQFALTDPAMRAALWDILWTRDYTRYAGLTNQVMNPPTDWPLADRMRIYIRKDVATQMLSLSLGPAMMADLPATTDVYASVEQQMIPAQVIKNAGLNAPRGLAIGPDGSIFVADTANSRIVKFDKLGNLLTAWGSRTPDKQTPPAPGTFSEPWGIAVDSAGNVFVADTWNHRIQKFDTNGTFLLEWSSAGLASNGPGKFWGPRGIAVGPQGRLYITDTGNKRVVVYDSNGKFLFEFGTQGEGQLDEPVGVAVGPKGNIYVADTWNRRVTVFSGNGEFINSWPVQGWAGGSADNKPYLAVDAQGRVYVTDPEAYHVLVFSPNGQPSVAFGQYGPEEAAFGLPTGIAVDYAGALWVADAGNNRLAKFAALQP
jgi:sugar lactone lactonase YvrE